MAKINKTTVAKPVPAGSKARENIGSVVYAELNGDNGNGKIRCKSLIVDGVKYRTRLNKKYLSRRAWESPDPRKITSNIPGTILKINIKEGQKVSKGDIMLILESMKMKNNIIFHIGGTVKKIHVREGIMIPKDYLMIELK